MHERRRDLNKLTVESTPHIHGKTGVSRIMLYVILALTPAAAAGCLYYGRHAVLLLLVTTGSAMLFEALSSLLFRHKQTLFDLSAAVTGLMLGMLLPPDFPLWKAALGSFIAITAAKQLFGGIGRNIANPAGVAWISLLLLFTKDMTTWRIPETGQLTRLTPLVTGHTGYWDLILGNYPSYIGTGCALGLVLGMLFLCLTGIISPAAPAAFLGAFAVLSFAGGYDVPGELLSGSIMLAACFMACDYTTTPFSASGKLLFGTGCGILTFLIRHFGGYPEGAVFAVVAMNLLTPALNRMTKKTPFGAVTLRKKEAKKSTSVPAE